MRDAPTTQDGYSHPLARTDHTSEADADVSCCASMTTTPSNEYLTDSPRLPTFIASKTVVCSSLCLTESASTTRAALFDVDGTLVDSNYLHVRAWQRAFREVGHDVDAWRVHRAIGLDSSLLLQSLLGDDADELGDRAKDLHTTYYLGARDSMRPLSGARELIRELHGRGVQVVLATSAPEEELDVLREILSVDSYIAHTTSSEDVDHAKPDPGVVRAAMDRASSSPDTAVMVGDAVWDGKAASRAGVTFVGLLSGGISRAELTEAGAAAVFEDAQDLLDNLESSPLAKLLVS